MAQGLLYPVVIEKFEKCAKASHFVSCLDKILPPSAGRIEATSVPARRHETVAGSSKHILGDNGSLLNTAVHTVFYASDRIDGNRKNNSRQLTAPSDPVIHPLARCQL
jgi:hypothetical protein